MLEYLIHVIMRYVLAYKLGIRKSRARRLLKERNLEHVAQELALRAVRVLCVHVAEHALTAFEQLLHEVRIVLAYVPTLARRARVVIARCAAVNL